MSSLNTAGPGQPGKGYWRSLDELADTPEFRKFVEREFPAYADQMLAPTSRRNFLKFMGASLALAGATACRWPAEEILPFAHRPDGYVPGEAAHFATAMDLAGVATGLLVSSYDGRPVKIEGNPMHPSSLGASSALAQASVLELYDPDRSRYAARFDNGKAVARTWADFEKLAGQNFAALKSVRGRGFHVLSEASSSPSLHDMRARLLDAFPEARWHEYEPLSRDNAREGSRQAFGRPYRIQAALVQAEVIVSLDEDFLFEHPAAVRYARDFIGGRDVDRHKANRLWVVESRHSLTGAMADHRIAVPSETVSAMAGCLAARLFLELGVELPRGTEDLRSVLRGFRSSALYDEMDPAMAQDLADRAGRSLLLVGSRQPATVHALAHVVNHALGNPGRTLSYTSDPDPDRPSHAAAIRDLAEHVSGGRVDTLLILGGNPVYDAPADLDFARLMGQAKMSVHLSLYKNETSLSADWHLPRSHYLESWSDARDWRGTLTIVQPLIEPLFGGKTPAELLALVIGQGPTDGHAIARRTFAAQHQGVDWRQVLHDGLAADSAWLLEQPQLAPAGWAEDLAATPAVLGGDEVELTFVPDASVHDGRFANSGWLQETPDPLTKLTWDNAALVGPATAERLGVEQGDMLRLEAEGRSLEVPVYVMPGQPAGSVALPLGYGRSSAGRVGDTVGFDTYRLRTSGAMDRVRARATKTGDRYLLATTQDHYAMDPLGAEQVQLRAGVLAREMNLEEFRHGGDDGHGEHGPHEAHLWKAWEYEGHKWGMAIDLNSCVGCNACLLACQSENNIPVVGKDEVHRGREMHWLRVDRYFRGDPEAPGVVHQPVACQHCENAPCELVCPVAATVHNDEGLNVMVYNRCVGTRYCMNNCPFKVRRFNYFNNHKNEDVLQTMVYNPEVTVRSRGVMEKCTYCLQRINQAKIQAKNERRPIRDGEVTTACAQSCPTRAITFGDLNDESSRVRKLHENARAYGLLGLLDVRPRTRYLTRVRNPANGHGTEDG